MGSRRVRNKQTEGGGGARGGICLEDTEGMWGSTDRGNWGVQRQKHTPEKSREGGPETAGQNPAQQEEAR